MKRGNESTLDLMGILEIRDHSIITKRWGEIVYFLIKPSNLSVLSQDSIDSRIYALMTVLKGISDIGMMCINSRENFDSNKIYLKRRIEQEPSPVIRRLLQADLKELDNLQIEMATAREFIITIKPKEKTAKDRQALLSNIERTLVNEGFVTKLADKDDIKRILGVYFVQDVTTDKFDDYDGESYFKVGDFNG